MEIEDDDDKNLISKHEAEYEDVLTVSMMKLYSAQDAFKFEVQKLKDIGKEDHNSADHSSRIIEQNELLGDLKTELDERMKQKMEVEVQYVAISRAIEHWNVGYEPMVDQKKEQMEMMKKLEDAEVKAVGLKMQLEKLQETCEEILEKEQVWEARNGD